MWPDLQFVAAAWDFLLFLQDFELWFDLGHIVAQNVFLILILGKLSSFHLIVSNSGAIHVKMDGSVLHHKSSFEMLRFSFSSKLDAEIFC